MLNPSALTPAPGRRLAHVTLGVAVLCLLLFAPGVHAQKHAQRPVSMPGSRSPVAPKEPELPVRDKAAKGLAPLSRLYEYVKVYEETFSRLPPLPESEKEDRGTEGTPRIGAVRTLQRPIKASADGSLYKVPEGEVRVMGAVSEGALFVRVHFSQTALPPGARLFVYSLKNRDEIYGPYEGMGPNGDGSFWSPPVTGEAAAVELFIPNPDAAAQAEDYFQITEVSHIFADPLAEADRPAGDCHLEVTSDYENAATGVGLLEITSGTNEYTCTGTLLTDKLSDFVPYLITANHCIDTQAEAQSLRVYWKYNSGDYPDTDMSHTDSSLLLSASTATDYAFVRLTGIVPRGLWYSGWTTTVPAGGTPVTGIHHPHGSHKRISFGKASSTKTGCKSGVPGPCANFTRVYWDEGVTESGSSGSGIFVGSASDPRYVGNLWGGDSSCDEPTKPDWYGRFDLTYPHISQYLDPAITLRYLTVRSFNPTSGVFINISPSDTADRTSGTTNDAQPLRRIYLNNAAVSLTAPATVGDGFFRKWQRNGVDWSYSRSTSVTMNRDYEMKAVYVTPPSLIITRPADGQTFSTGTITVSGTATDAGRGNTGIVSVTVNGVRASGDTAVEAQTANWARSVFLNPGANTITVVARDGEQSSTTRTITVNRRVTGGPYTISGIVRSNAVGLGNVRMTLDGGAGFTPRTVLTASTGAYTFTNVPAGRNYIVTPSRLGYAFTPAYRLFPDLSANQTQTTASFAAALKIYSSNIVRPIPDQWYVDVPLEVNDMGAITDLNVRVRLNHTYDADLDLYLIGPDGTTVELTSDNGADGDNYGSGANSCASTPTIFDSSALAPVASGLAPFAGRFKPEQSLSVFNGKSSAGTWRLRIADDAPADVGVVYCWELQFNRP